MRLVAAAILKYRLTLLGVVLLLVLGSIAYLMIPRREDPLIKVPGATVLVRYPGAGPRDVEKYVSIPLEEKINEIDTVDKITSSSSQGTSAITVEFDPDSDMDQNMQELREKVRETEKDFPSESLDPEITRWKTETVSLIINLSGPFNYRELFRYAKYIRRDLEKIPEIMTIAIEGDQEREVHVEIDEKRLSQYLISLSEVIDQIRAENISLPGGHMDVGRRSYLVRTDEEFIGAKEIGRTIVGSYGGRPVFLDDLAQIRDTYERPEYLVRFNGRESLNILVTQKPRANLQSAAKEIRSHLHNLSQRLPPQLNVEVFSDQAISVSDRLSDFRNNLFMGAGLVIMVTIFLMNVRMAAIIAFLIPLSIAFALIMLYHLGHSLNQITLAALIIVLGMLVDNGIVVVENIQRHLGMAKDRLSAALDGSKEVLGAITSSTLTTVLAFTPLLFMSGNIGQFVRGIPLTVIFALTGSLLVGVFVSPLLSNRFLKRPGQKEKRDHWVLKGYLHVLRWSLDNKVLTLTLALAAFLGSLVFISRLGLQFFPKAEKKTFIIEAFLPQGSNIKATLKLAKRIEKLLMSKEEVENIVTHVGGNGSRIYYNINSFRIKEPHRVQFFVTIRKDKKDITTTQVIHEIRPLLDRISGASIELKELEQGPPVGAPIAVKIRGDDLRVLQRLAKAYRALLEAIPGAVDVSDDASDTVAQIKIRVDSDKARLLGITNATIAQTMRTAIYGTSASTFRQEDEEVDVVVSLGETSRNNIGTFDEIYLKSMAGFKTLFSQVAQIDLISDIGTINRENLTRTVTVRSDAQGKLPESIVKELSIRAASLKIPPGYLVEFEGENKERSESFMSLGWAMMAAFMLVYIVLVAQFNSYKQPFTIALSLPFGLVGAVLGLWITGYPFGFMAFLGVVSLTGIVVNDAIVLIDFINSQREGGMDVRGAVTEAGRLRFRPVMLTTISTVGGLLPLAIRGGSLWGPMGNVIIFGLSMATLLTLILVPIMYEVLERKRVPKGASRKEVPFGYPQRREFQDA
jgi:multidrug efflux pump subunit AcrB